MTDQAQTPESLQIAIHAQYIRDFSFESPNAPHIFTQTQASPILDVGVNVQTRSLEGRNFEVVLMLKLEAKIEDKVAFIAELAYAGVFGLPSMPEDHLKAFLLMEAPRLLFPFARSIIANAVRDGGFPQILINPIDFGAIYQQQIAQAVGAPQGNA